MRGENEAQEVIMPDELIDEIAQRAGEFCLKQMRDEQSKARERARKEQRKRTRELLKKYRRMKQSLKDEERFSSLEQRDYRWRFVDDLVGHPSMFEQATEGFINDFENDRTKKEYCIWKIDQALKNYGEEVAEGKEQDRRRYDEFRAMYIDGSNAPTYDEVADRFNVSRTVCYEDITRATAIFEEYLGTRL